jgi:apolipoprotein D and lipocalin family protein
LAPVGDFDIARYAGTWYEIARLDHPFERGLRSVTAEYTPRDDGTIRVVNTGYDPGQEAWTAVEGTARFKGSRDVGLLEVTFFWPFYGTYKIIGLDKTRYAYAMVTGATYDYLWILSREPVMRETTLDALVTSAREMGFATRRLIYVDQRENVAHD